MTTAVHNLAVNRNIQSHDTATCGKAILVGKEVKEIQP